MQPTLGDDVNHECTPLRQRHVLSWSCRTDTSILLHEIGFVAWWSWCRSRIHHFRLRGLLALGGGEGRPYAIGPSEGEAEFEDPASFCTVDLSSSENMGSVCVVLSCCGRDTSWDSGLDGEKVRRTWQRETRIAGDVGRDRRRWWAPQVVARPF